MKEEEFFIVWSREKAEEILREHNHQEVEYYSEESVVELLSKLLQESPHATGNLLYFNGNHLTPAMSVMKDGSGSTIKLSHGEFPHHWKMKATKRNLYFK